MAESGRSISRFWSSAKTGLRNFWDTLEPEANKHPAAGGAASGALSTPTMASSGGDAGAWGDTTLGAGADYGRAQHSFAIDDDDDDDVDAPAVSDASLADAEEELERLQLDPPSADEAEAGSSPADAAATAITPAAAADGGGQAVSDSSSQDEA